LLLNFCSVSAPPTAFKLSTSSGKEAIVFPPENCHTCSPKLQPKSRLPEIKADSNIIPNSLRNGVALNFLITDESLPPDSNRKQVLRKTKKTMDNGQPRNVVTRSLGMKTYTMTAGQCLVKFVAK
jgi:hypothetical protein